MTDDVLIEINKIYYNTNYTSNSTVVLLWPWALTFWFQNLISTSINANNLWPELVQFIRLFIPCSLRVLFFAFTYLLACVLRARFL